MTPLVALWLPIILSAVLVFIASSIIHMFLGYHSTDYVGVPDEPKARAALGPLAIPPGDYSVPYAGSSAAMRSPEFAEKMKEGPVVIFTVMPAGPITMGKTFVQWFLFLVVVGILAAYVTGRALAPGADYLEVFRFAGTTAFIAYAVGLWPLSIWYRRKWSTTIKSTLDGLIYGLLTAGVFGWLWP